MIQAEPLCQLLDKVKDKRPELTIISFTGFRKENLTAPAQIQLLNTIDLLIDGEYVDELNDGMGLRGSSNQRLHFMSNRLLPFKEELEHGKRVIEFHIQQDKTVAYGRPKRKMFN
jgi:anaerobic ribonucleoside-triphosphate reductase activating protein